jgi:hypothetical protein
VAAVLDAELEGWTGSMYSKVDIVVDPLIGLYKMWQLVVVLTSTMKEGKNTYIPKLCMPMKPHLC